MIALLRYQAAILLRSHRWIFPLIAYVLLIAVGAAGAGAGAGDGVVTIELAGVEGAGLAGLADLPGVLSCSPAGVGGRVLVRVAAGQSDAVLRQALARDGVHVAGVRVADAGVRVADAGVRVADEGRPR